MTITYPAVTVVGGMLSGSLVQRIGDGATDLPGSDAEAYGLQAGESVRREANSAFAYLKDVWRDFTKQRERAGTTVPARLTRERWLLILLRKLGYDGIEALPGGIAVDDKPFPISHQWQTVPVHLLGWGIDLDTRTAGTRGAATAAPHAMVQQVLNRADDHLWAVLSNGQQLRLLRDSTSLVGSAYLEFDLDAIFDGDLFPDFVLLYRIAHASRLAVRDPETGPSSCFMEAWRAYGAVQGERALEQLRGNVKRALELLGTGFLDHPGNPHLRGVIGGELSLEDFQRSLLRLVYKLLFWFVAEDRGALLDPAADSGAAIRYDAYFSARRLRDLAVRRRHSRHGDLWEAAQLVFNVLGSEKGWPQLGLPGIGGLFEDGALDEPLKGARLSNIALLQAVEALAVLPARSHTGRQRVDFRHLGAEELGSVYESLLELRPRWDPGARSFQLEQLAGNERKTTGSYYTPSSLVECLLDSALDPLLDEATALPTREERIAALLALTVCDPACGSGHFLIAAARRIAKRLAVEWTDELEPPVSEVQKAMRQVVGQCIYGVDVNEMAAELAKVSLWLEAMEPGRPLSYLDSNIRVGNSLLGVTPRLLADGIPDAAFAALEGDERSVVSALKRQNAQERSGQLDFLAMHGIPIANAKLADEVESIIRTDPRSLADVHVQAKRARELEGSEERRQRKLVADAWCAAFVQPKTEETRAVAITEGMLKRLAAGEETFDLVRVEETVEELTRQYRFFHWHIEFPHIFRVPEWGEPNSPTGWQGGFSCVLGNPPWDQVQVDPREFFAASSPKIAVATNMAARNKMIEQLANENPQLHSAYIAEVLHNDSIKHFVHDSGRFPLTSFGRLNTYSLFAETSRNLVSQTGQSGLIVPTGIATDSFNQFFFRDLVEARSLTSLYDFENEDKIFPGVHNQFRFALFIFGGCDRLTDRISLVFRARQASQIAASTYSLTPGEIAMLNPNTGTCPVFNSRRDAEIILEIYRRLPVLIREKDTNENPWGVNFQLMFMMNTDSGSFHSRDQLERDDWLLHGNTFVRDSDRMLPLFEAKMIHHFDHRYSTYFGATQQQLNKGTLPHLDDIAHDDPDGSPVPHYWVAENKVIDRLTGRWDRGWLLGWRDICRSVDERTLIGAVIPRTAVGHKYLLAFPGIIRSGLQANWSSFVLDYVVRQKFSGSSLAYFFVKQLPILPPIQYENKAPWDSAISSLDAWISARVLELTYTAFDIAAYATDLGDDGPPFRWEPARREMMRAELDGAYFHLYGIERDDVDYIMDTFKVVRQKDDAKHGEYRTKRLILERYDAMAAAIRTGLPYQTLLDPPPGHGPRHPIEGAVR